MEVTTFVCPSLGATSSAKPWYKSMGKAFKELKLKDLSIPTTRSQRFAITTPSQNRATLVDTCVDGADDAEREASTQVTDDAPVWGTEFSDIEDDCVYTSCSPFAVNPVKRQPKRGCWRRAAENCSASIGDLYKDAVVKSASHKHTRPRMVLPSTNISCDDLVSSANANEFELVALARLRKFVSKCLPKVKSEWEEVVCRLAWTAARRVNTHYYTPNLDIMSCVDIMALSVGDVSECEYVPGIAFRKHTLDHRMPRTIRNSSILLIGGTCDIERCGSLIDLEARQKEEIRLCEMLFEAISDWAPKVVLVEHNMHRRIVQNLCLQHIIVATQVKRNTLEKIALSTGATIVSLDYVIMEEPLYAQPDGNPCGTFSLVHAFSDVAPPIIYVVPQDRGHGSGVDAQGTMILRGESKEKLRHIKKLLRFLTRAAYNMLLEVFVYRDLALSLPKSDECSSFISTSLHCNDFLCIRGQLDGVTKETLASGGILDPLQNQTIVMHRIRCLVDKNSDEDRTNQVESHLCSLTFYDRTKNDITLSEAIGEWAAQTMEDRGQHLVVTMYGHGNGCISVRGQTSEERVPPNRIAVRSECNICGHRSDKRLLCAQSHRYSFGKFLETMFYNTETCTGCDHPMFANRTITFGRSFTTPYANAEVRFQFHSTHPYTVIRPETTTSASTQQLLAARKVKMFDDERLELTQAWSQALSEIRTVFDDIERQTHMVMSTSVNIAQEELSQRVISLVSTKRQVLHVEEGEIIDILHQCSDVLDLQLVRRRMYTAMKDWPRHLGEVWAPYLGLEIINFPDEVREASTSNFSSAIQTASNTTGGGVVNTSLSAAEQHQAQRSLVAVSASQTDSNENAGLPGLLSRVTSSKKNTRLGAPTLQIPECVWTSQTHLYCGVGATGKLVTVRENEPTSIIAHTLNSEEYLKYNPFAKHEFVIVNAPSGIDQSGFSICATHDFDEFHHRDAPGESINAHHGETSVLRGEDYDDEQKVSAPHKSRPARPNESIERPETLTALGSLPAEEVEMIYQALIDRSDFHFDYRFKSAPPMTSSSPSPQFTCTVFYARQFHALRRLYTDGDDASVVESLSRSVPYSPSGGKSGSSFVMTLDTRYILKQVSAVEMRHFLKSFAPEYFTHMCRIYFGNYKSTFVKVFGAFKVSWKKQKASLAPTFYILMENLFFDRNISRVYDLKGNLRNRWQTDEKSTLLDANLLRDIERRKWLYVTEKDKEDLNLAIHNDTLLLSMQRIMDYSLLLGVDDENGVLYVGLVDYFREYDFKKQWESIAKATAGGGEPTIVNPKNYKKRFRNAMRNYFPLLPTNTTPFVIKTLELYSLLDSAE